jgi:hypothetical protein
VIFDTDRIVSDAAYREDMRHRFETDHFFAAQTIGFPDFSELRHRAAVDLYFPKNRLLPIKDQHQKKKRLHLDPRRTFKTTLKRVERAQWIAAFPETITILNVSATQPLAEEVSVKTAGLFYRAPGEAATVLQLMYPELVTDRNPQASPNKQRWVWNTLLRRGGGAVGDLDSTLAYTSPKSTQSGWHPLMLDFDDVEDTNNSGIGVTEEVRQGVINTCDQNENLLGEDDYLSIGGTRYHPFDYYATCLRSAEENPENWVVLVRGSLRTHNGARLLPGEFPREEDCELLFPEFLSYNFLREKFHKNYESFMCQQMNDPQGGAVPVFDEKLYASCLVALEKIPFVGHSGEVFTCWRVQYGGKSNMAKFTEGAAAKVIDGKVYVIDTWQTTRTPTGLAEMMVQEHKHHQADGMMILDTPGSEFMSPLIRNEAARRNVSIRIHRPYWEEDDSRRASQIKSLEPLMRVGRLLFSTAMTKAAATHSQFVHFGLVEENGIIDCINQFAQMVPMSQMRANMQEEELEYQRKQRDNALVSGFLEQQGMPIVDDQVRMKAQAHMAAMSKVQSRGIGMPPLPGGLDG